MNANPELTNVTANGQAVQPNEIVKVQSGNTLTFQFNTADANTGDSVKIAFPDPNFTGFPANTFFSASAGLRPTGTITFNTTATPTDQFFYFPLTVMDNACPARGVTTRIYGVKLLASPLGYQKERTEVAFTAFPNPFTDAVMFSISALNQVRTIKIYNLLGQQIEEIQLKMVGSGGQKVQWQNASRHAAGTYVAKLISEDKTIQTLKFVKLQ